MTVSDLQDTLIMDTKDMVFVFGSNESGRHGAGAARFAQQFKGAHEGLAFGFSGQSFAIPTKDKLIRNTLSLGQIQLYVNDFIHMTYFPVESYPQLSINNKTFQVTRIGCGLAGLNDADVAPMFKDANERNTFFDLAWEPYLGPKFSYWGDYR